MKKTCLILLALLTLMCVGAQAASTVRYEGGAEKFVFLPGTSHSESDLFDSRVAEKSLFARISSLTPDLPASALEIVTALTPSRLPRSRMVTPMRLHLLSSN